MTEEGNFQKRIMQWLDDLGLYAVKYNASGISKVGVPDILCNLHGTFLAIEVKKEKGIVSEIQKHTIIMIDNDGGIAIVLRPSNFKRFKELILTYEVTKDIKRLKKELLYDIGVE